MDEHQVSAWVSIEGREGVARRMRELQAIRNRIAHHDSLLGQDVERVVGEMLAIAGWVDPQAAGWLRRVARVEAALAGRP